MQRNKYSDAYMTEHKYEHHEEMKANTEYRKRKHKIAQDEDKLIEEIELRKLRKSSDKVFKHIYEQSLNTEMRK